MITKAELTIFKKALNKIRVKTAFVHPIDKQMYKAIALDDFRENRKAKNNKTTAGQREPERQYNDSSQSA